MKRKAFIFALASILFLMVLVVAGIISERTTATEPLDGWKIIRPPIEVSAMAEDIDFIWVGGRDGVFSIIKNNLNSVIELKENRSFSYVRALMKENNGGPLWIGHRHGLTKYRNNKFLHYTTEDGLPGNWITSIHMDCDGIIWVGTFNGAAYFYNQQWHAMNSDDGLIVDMVNIVFSDSQGGVFFGSYVAPRGGLSYNLNGRWQYFNTENGLPHNNINAIYEDNSGQIWVGTGFYNRGGLVVLKRDDNNQLSIVKTYQENDGLAGAKVRSVFQDNQGRIFIGYEFNGFSILSGDNLKHYTIYNGLSDNEIKVFLQDNCGHLWLGSMNGITHIDRSSEIFKIDIYE